MKRATLFISLLFLSLHFIQGQVPQWKDATWREFHYPHGTFFTGSASILVADGLSVSKAIIQAKTEAQADLVKKIRVKVSAVTQNKMMSRNINGTYHESESFLNESSTEANAEVVGLKIEAYHDVNDQTVYAFAYVNKYELAGYYKAQINMLLQQVDHSLQTARQLEANGEKVKAREECQKALSYYPDIHSAQEMLTSVDATNEESLQQEKSGMLYNELTQMSARLIQGVHVYINCQATLFGLPYPLLLQRVKALLTEKGCSFVEDAVSADFQLTIQASTRMSSIEDEIQYCFADIIMEWFDNHKMLAVFNDGFSCKGGSMTMEKAGRTALDKAAKEIVKKLNPWLQ